jgi:regulator of sigma E protease
MRVVLTSLFTRDVSLKQLSGPVGIYNFVGQMEDEGISSILYLIAILSINIGFINLLPFPAFDGGRILFLLIEKIKGSPIDSKTENIIHTIGFVLIMILMIYITFNDIFKLF